MENSSNGSEFSFLLHDLLVQNMTCNHKIGIFKPPFPSVKSNIKAQNPYPVPWFNSCAVALWGCLHTKPFFGHSRAIRNPLRPRSWPT